MKTTTTYGLIITLFLFFYPLTSFSQESYWHKEEKNTILLQNKTTYQRDHLPQEYDLYSLDVSAFGNQLKSKGGIIYLPNVNGKLMPFTVLEETPYLAPELARRFPMIHSYTAQGVDDPAMVAKISLGTDGFHAVISPGPKGAIYIDPYTKDNQMYIVYDTSSLDPGDFNFSCDVEEVVKKSTEEDKLMKTSSFHDGKLRAYRLAVTVIGEYSQYHLRDQGVPDTATDLEKKAAVLSAINTTMTRVNAIFERDISVRMVLVANNDDIIFLDPNTDGIDDTSTRGLFGINRFICDSLIGNENYDIGHIFGCCPDSGPGLASLRSVCSDTNKARGVSIGNKGYNFVRLITHEMGHQFGANHVQNNSCQRSSASVEPGSGSTIMSYAGGCSPNVQRSSDHYFNISNIKEMWSTIQNSATCGVEIDMGNTPPVIVNVGNPDADEYDYVIPKSTPFVLRGSATDSNNSSSLTYAWEQMDSKYAQMPPLPTNVEGPMFRSLPPSSSPNRYMPDLATVVAGSTASTWEVLPSVSRELNFIFTARDNNPGAGSFVWDSANIFVDDSVGPFVVTSQTGNVTWSVGSSQEITWDVAGTDGRTLNTPTVNILLSIDGGQTFPIILASAVPNDGSHTITVPQIAGGSNQARIMVEANNNIFYAVNSSNFIIEKSEFGLSLDTPNISTCTSNNIVYAFTYNTFLGFNEATAFSAVGLPVNATASFNPPSASFDGTRVTLTVSGIENVDAGSHTFQVQGESGNITSVSSATMNVYKDEFLPSILNLPLNGEARESLTPTLQWSKDVNATSYDLEVATDASFNTIIINEDISTNFYSFFHHDRRLNQNTTYYWRVKPKNNCYEGTFSSISRFTTIPCWICPSQGELEEFIVGTTRVVFNTIDNSSDIETVGYNDYQNISTNVEKGNNYSLSIQVTTGGPFYVHTLVWIDWNQDCDFDEPNEIYDLGIAVYVNNSFTSLSPLGISIPADASLGRTVMRVTTKYDSDPSSCENDAFAEVEDYSIVVQDATKIASKDVLLSKNNDVEDFSFEGFDLYPNPTQGMFTVRFKTVSKERVFVKVMDLSGRTVFAKKYKNVSSDFSERVVLDNVSSGIYLLQIENGGKQTTRKLLIE